MNDPRLNDKTLEQYVKYPMRKVSIAQKTCAAVILVLLVVSIAALAALIGAIAALLQY